MKNNNLFVARVALTVALGGFLMGFDASVISGVVGFIENEFQLTKLQLGWSVSSLTLTSTLAMIVSGPLSDRFGRRQILKIAAVLYALSAITSALAPTFVALVAARMLGGLGVGASLILAPMYIAEIAPSEVRGRMVSFNQLNIVIGISAAFFTNYLILQWAQSDAGWTSSLGFSEHTWRWMLGLETLPAILYFFGLYFVPRSPRWLIMKNKIEEAKGVLINIVSQDEANRQIRSIRDTIDADLKREQAKFSELFKPALRLVLAIGFVVSVLQQITGINSVFFYAPMIFEQSGIGTDASFMQAILVGITNLVFTILAILLIDKLGRKPLLIAGISGIVLFMGLLSYGFGQASYTLPLSALETLPTDIPRAALQPIISNTYDTDIAYKEAINSALGEEQASNFESTLITAAISMNPTLILIGIIGFVASFAVSIGPVMWVLFSELFPNRVRGLAISLAGFVNSAVSFLVQLVFPWELTTLGSSMTFLLYGIFALAGLIFVIVLVPETKEKSLEELEAMLIKEA